MSRIAGNELESCTFSGGIDCAWLAAFAEFIFGFSVDVKNSDRLYSYRSSTGHRVYSGDAQITILVAIESQTSVELTRKCFSLPSGKPLLHRFIAPYLSPSESTSPRLFHTRSPWTSILEDSFGVTTQRLLAERAAKCFARLLQTLAYEKPPYPSWVDSEVFPTGQQEDTALWHLRCLNQSPYGDDMLRFVAWRLPELQSCLQTIQSRPFTNISPGSGVLFTHINELSALCGCIHCGPSESYEGVPLNEFPCIKRLARTIIAYIAVLAVIEVDGVLPAQLGLRNLYSKFAPPKGSSLFQFGLGIFSTSEEQSRPVTSGSEVVAFASNGVCGWHGLLTDLKSSPETCTRIHIAQGHIQYEGSLFQKITEMKRLPISRPSEMLKSPKRYDLLVQELQAEVLQVVYKAQDVSAPTCMYIFDSGGNP